MKITKKMLEEYGMVETKDPVHSWQKTITSDHIEDPEAGVMAIVIDMSYNEPHFALCMPGGAMLHLRNVKDMEELRAFESMIMSYEPNY